MKIKIYNAKEEKEILLKLIRREPKTCLEVVNKQGKRITSLLSINDDGELNLYSCVDKDLGLKLDDEDRMVIHLK